MKKHIRIVFAFAVFAASALASQGTELEVKVPFAFKAGTSTLPAGTYRVTEIGSGCILIRGEKGGVFVPNGAVAIDMSNSGNVSLKFDLAGSKYVLQSVHATR